MIWPAGRPTHPPPSSAISVRNRKVQLCEFCRKSSHFTSQQLAATFLPETTNPPKQPCQKSLAERQPWRSKVISNPWQLVGYMCQKVVLVGRGGLQDGGESEAGIHSCCSFRSGSLARRSSTSTQAGVNQTSVPSSCRILLAPSCLFTDHLYLHWSD